MGNTFMKIMKGTSHTYVQGKHNYMYNKHVMFILRGQFGPYQRDRDEDYEGYWYLFKTQYDFSAILFRFNFIEFKVNLQYFFPCR